MSSISNSRSNYTSANSTVYLKPLNEEQLEVMVDDGDPNTVDSPKVLTKDEANRLLAAQGLKFENGQVRSLDGFEASSKKTVAGGAKMDSGVVADDGQPNIPTTKAYSSASGSDPVDDAGETEGTSESSEELNARISDALGQMTFFNAEDLEAAALLWKQFTLIADQEKQNLQMAKQIKYKLQESKINNMVDNFEALERQIEGERQAARDKLITACVTFVVVAGASAYGAKVGGASGQAITNTAQSGGQLINAINEFVTTSTAAGGTYKAKEAEKLKARLDIEKEGIEQGIDQVKNIEQEAREAFKAALRAVLDFIDRQTQVNSKIFS